MSSRKPIGEAELERLQHQSFSYFLHETNPDNGLVIDKTAPDWPASIAATGFALAAYPVAVERGFMPHAAVPYGPDDGTIAPWAVVTSLPFASEIVLPTIDYFINEVKLTEFNPYGFKATFNPTYPVKSGNPCGWVSPWHYGLNQGPIILMIENYRTGLVWQLMRDCPYIASGLRRAGFGGGWL
jgi:hypothetical protein